MRKIFLKYMGLQKEKNLYNENYPLIPRILTFYKTIKELSLKVRI